MSNGYKISPDELDIKPNLETLKTICRCCLSRDRLAYNIINFAPYINELAGLNVSESDALPQWICYECAALLCKAVRFKCKLTRANYLLTDYLSRCTPFSIDAQDPELIHYASPLLKATETLTLDNIGRSKVGFRDVLEHKKIDELTVLHYIEPLQSPVKDDETQDLKEEVQFSDFEDNITLNEFKQNLENLAEHDFSNSISESTLDAKDQSISRKEKKKKKEKKREVKVKRNKLKEKEVASELEETKSSIRKPLELDPTKIRIVTLKPEEQIKMREEEMKATLKFPFQCNLCFKGFNFEGKLENHMSKHSPSRGKYACKICQMYLPTQYSYNVHSVIHTRRYECVKCGRRMIDKGSILDHYRTQHEGLMTLYTCTLCGKISNNSKTHRGHMRNHHAGDRPKCDQCGKSFVNKDSLTEHMQIHQGIKNYECPICHRKFRTRTQIKHHQLKHSDLKQYYCVECDVRFKSSHSLQQHLNKSLKHKDTQSLQFGCNACEKRFETEPKLRHHVRVQHEGVRAYTCETCGAALATKNSLHKHTLSVHAGQRAPPRHVCDTCGKAFRGKSVLVNHVRTHTGEKPFECTVCGRKFTQRTAMNTHVKLVHLKIPRCSAKIKPEIRAADNREEKVNIFPKEEPQLVFESWTRPGMQPLEYYTVTAGP